MHIIHIHKTVSESSLETPNQQTVEPPEGPAVPVLQNTSLLSALQFAYKPGSFLSQ